VDGREVSGKKLAKDVYIALRFGEDWPVDLVRVYLAERFGWTLDYIDSLDMEEVLTVLEVLDGMDLARKGG